jgi:addiction module HigA family antidote
MHVMSPNKLTAGLRPTHPGEVLREDVLPALGRPKAEIARLLGVSRAALYNVLDEKAAVTPDMALRLGRLFGRDPDIWLAMQHAYDLKVRARELAGELDKIKAIKVSEAA